MALGITNRGNNYAAVTSTTVVIGSLTIGEGSTIVVCVGGGTAIAADVTSVVYNDGVDNFNLTQRAIATGGSNASCSIWSADNVGGNAGGGQVTITIGTTDANWGGLVIEVTGAETTGSFDKSAGASARSTAVDSGVTATTTQNDEAVIGCVATNFSSGCSITLTGTCTDNAQGFDFGVKAFNSATKIVSATGTYNYAGTITKEYWAAAVATFKGASGAAPTIATPSLGSITTSLIAPAILIMKSVLATASSAIASIIANTPTVSISVSKQVNATTAYIQAQSNTPSVTITNSANALANTAYLTATIFSATASTVVSENANANPSICLVSVSAQSVITSIQISMTAEATTVYLNAVATSPTILISKSSIVSADTVYVTTTALTATASTFITSNAETQPNISIFTTSVISPTIQVSESRTAIPSLATVTVELQTASTTITQSAIVTPSTAYITTTVFTPTVTVNSPFDVTTACEGFWKLNENAASSNVIDTMGAYNGNLYSNNSLVNTEDYDTTGKLNGGFDWGDGTSLLAAKFGDVLDKAWNAAFSCEIWFKSTNTAAEKTLMCKYDPSVSKGWLFYIDGTTLALYFRDNEGEALYAGQDISAKLDGNWHHAVMTYSGGGDDDSVILYLDSNKTTFVASGSPINSTATLTNQFAIGIREAGTGSDAFPFIGQLDNARIYNRVLTDIEVVGLYNNGNGTEDLLYPVVGEGTTTATPSLAFISLVANSPTIQIMKSATASPAVATVSILPQSPTTLITKSALAIPAIASLNVSVFAPTTLISQSRIAIPSLASVTIAPQTATASTMVVQSSTATPNLANISIVTQTAVASMSISSTATSTTLLISAIANTATPSKIESRIASPNLQGITVQVNTPTVSCFIITIVSVNTVYVSITAQQPTASITKSQAITSTLVSLSVSALTPTVEKHISTIASPAVIPAAIFINSATTEVHNSASVTPAVATLSVEPQTPSATFTRSVQVEPQTILMAIVTETAIASTIESSTATPSLAPIRMALFNATATVTLPGVISGIDVDILLESRIQKYIKVNSLIAKSILKESSFEKALYKKSRISKQINLESEIGKLILEESQL